MHIGTSRSLAYQRDDVGRGGGRAALPEAELTDQPQPLRVGERHDRRDEDAAGVRLLDPGYPRHPPVERLVGDQLPVPGRVERGARSLLHRQCGSPATPAGFRLRPVDVDDRVQADRLGTTPPQPASKARMMLASDRSAAPTRAGTDSRIESGKVTSTRRHLNCPPERATIPLPDLRFLGARRPPSAS